MEITPILVYHYLSKVMLPNDQQIAYILVSMEKKVIFVIEHFVRFMNIASA